MDVSTLRTPATLVVAAAVMATAALVVTTDAGTTVESSSPGAWVSSEGVDAVSRIGPGGAEVTIALGEPTGRLQVLEIDGVAYALDGAGALARIDPATFEVSVGVSLPGTELVAGGGRLYAVDRERGTSTELDVATLDVLTAPIEIGDSVGSAVVDGTGTLWVVDESSGDVVRVAGDELVSTTAVVAPSTAAGLAVLTGGPAAGVVVVDPVESTLTAMRDDGSVRRTIDAGSFGATRVLVPSTVGTGTIVPILDGGRLVAVDVASGSASELDLVSGNHRLGVPEVAAGRAYVADLTDATVIAVELATMQVTSTYPIEEAGPDFDVVAKGDYLYVNDPATQKAWVIGPDGALTAVDKYDPTNPGGRSSVPVVPAGPAPVSDARDDRAADPPPAAGERGPLLEDPSVTWPAPPSVAPPSTPAPTTPSPTPPSPPTPDPVGPPAAAPPPSSCTPGSDPACVPPPSGCDTGLDPAACPAPGDGAVRNVAASAGDAQATVTWSGPADWYDVIGYSVRVVPVGAPDATIGPVQLAAVGTYTQTGLVNGRHHYFVVEAIGPGNTRGAAIASPTVMPISTDPGRPRDVSVVADACAPVTLTWNAPDDGFDVAGYRVDVDRPGGASAWRTDVGGGTTSVTIAADALTAGDQFTVAVRAVSPSGATSPPADGGTLVPHCTPGRPGDVTAVASGDGSITVAWTAARPNGRPIDRHEIALTAANGSPVTRTAAADAASASVDGLTPGVAYTARVRARNANGWGSWRDATAPVVAVAAVPGPPRQLTVAHGDGGGTATWQRPAADGWTIVGYRVEVFADGDDVPVAGWNVAGGATSRVVTGLTNGTSYTVAVSAMGDDDGEQVRGTPAVSSAFTPRTVPAAVGGVSAVSSGDGVATVSWTAPDDGGSPITHYVVSQGTQTRQVPADQTQTDVGGLVNGQQYVFSVTAHNGEGAGPATAADPVLVQSHTPDAPGGPSATPGDGTATVAWTAPNGNGTAVVRYVVENVTTGAQAEPTGTQHTFTGLTNGTGYSFRVRAVGANGSLSAWAQATPSPVVPAGAPGVPTGVNAVAGDGRVTLSWQEPGGNGTTIARYEIRGPGVSTEASASPVDVTGLANGTAYSLEVRAVGANGVPGGWASAPTVTPSGRPAPPTGVNATPTSPHDATVSFSQTSPTNGTTVQSWIVRTEPASTTQTVSTPSATLSGLEATTTYTVVVIAVGANGLESDPATTTLTTPNGAVPAALTGLWASGGAYYSGTCPNPATASWDPTPGATGYIVDVLGDGGTTAGTDWWMTPPPGTHTVTVTPYNQYGTGPSQSASFTMINHEGMYCP